MITLLPFAIVMAAMKIAGAVKTKKRRAVRHVSAVENVAAGDSIIAEESVTRPISTSASTPGHAGCDENSTNLVGNCHFTLENNVCQLNIIGISNVSANEEDTGRNARHDVNASCVTSPSGSCMLKFGEFDAIPVSWTESSTLVNTVRDVAQSVTGTTGCSNVAETSELAPVPAIENVAAISTGSQPVTSDVIEDVAVSPDQSTAQLDQEVDAPMGQPSNAVTNQPLVSIDAPAPISQAQENRIRPPDSSDDPRLGQFNGAGLSNRKYKRHVIKLLAKKIPLPPPDLIITNRRLLRALPVSMDGQVRKWKRAAGVLM